MALFLIKTSYFTTLPLHIIQISLKLFYNHSRVELLNFHTDNREWKVEGTEAKHSSKKYPCCPETYEDVTFVFRLRRRSPAYGALIVVPGMGEKNYSKLFSRPFTTGEKIVQF